MIIARPSVPEERWLLLAARYPALRTAAEQLDHGGQWKTTTWLGRCLGFLLGLLGVGMLAGVLSQMPSPLMVGGAILVIGAEWLVAHRRVFRSGLEEAVYLCGALGIVVQLLIWSDGNNAALGVICVATAVLFVGWRLLNPLFTTLAAAGYSLAVATAGQSLFSGNMHTMAAGVACAVLSVVALIAGGLKYQRPAHDRMLDGLIITMPWLAHGWLTAYDWRASKPAILAVLVLALTFVVMNLIVGVLRRQRSPLISAMGSVVCAAFAFHQLVDWPLHWELIAAGTALLAAAVCMERLLHHRTEGLTASKQDESAAMDIVQLAGAAGLSPAPGSAPPAGVQGQGGGFGGGGASGKF
jgi:hypothetical protein